MAPPSSTVAVERRPSDLLTRVVAWPTVVLLLPGAVSVVQPGLVGALLGLVVLVVACGVLAAVDGSVLRPRQVVLVWSATLVVLGVAARSVVLPSLVEAAPLMVQAVATSMLPTLPWWFPGTAVGLVVPVTLGALLGRCSARTELPSTFGPLGPLGPVG